MQFRGTASGTIAKQVRPFAFPGQPEIENPMDVIVRIAADGAPIDTLKTFESGETFSISRGTPEFKIYSPEAVWDLTDEGKLLFAINDDYRVHVYSDNGELERIVSKPFEKELVAERDKEAMIGFMERAWSDAGVPAEAVQTLRNGVQFGEHFPAFATIIAGPVGTIWVQHIQTASGLSEDEYESFNPIEDTGAPDWDVFDAAGRYLGVVTMPRRFSPRIIRGEQIYGVWRDDLDVQYVTRLRVMGIQEYRERWGEVAD
jgi:hypothetical protein